MAFLTGEQTGPARTVDYLGMAAGIAAAISFAFFDRWTRVLAEGAWRTETMSATVRETNSVADQNGFLVYNLVVAILILLFTVAVARRLNVGAAAVVILAATVVGTIAIAFTCGEECTVSLPDSIHNGVHSMAAVVNVAAMVALPRVAAKKLARKGRTGWLRRASRYISWLVGLAFLFVALNVVGVFDMGGVAERAMWYVGYLWPVAASAAMYMDRAGRRPTAFPFGNIQRGVLYGSSKHTAGRFLAGHMIDPGRYRVALREALAEGLLTGDYARPGRPGDRTPAVVTHGLARSAFDPGNLDLPYRSNAFIEDAYDHGAAARAVANGDIGANGPRAWDPGWRDADACFWIQGDTTADVQLAVARIRSLFEDPAGQGLSLVVDVPTTRGPVGNRFLSFEDGISNPWIEKIHDPSDERREGGGNLTKDGWQQVRLGEFILGETDESLDVSPIPDPVDMFRHATFMVARHYEERRLIPLEAAQTFDYTRLVGRDTAGTPVADPLAPHSNTFTYGDDPDGLKCPLSGHIRRANPRDSLGFDGKHAHHRRILRRGMQIHGNGARPNGLMFVAYNARIADQFEFIQRRWFNEGQPFGSGNDPDPIAGMWAGPPRTIVVQGERPAQLTLQRPPFRLRGAGYFCVLSMDALRRL